MFRDAQQKTLDKNTNILIRKGKGQTKEFELNVTMADKYNAELEEQTVVQKHFRMKTLSRTKSSSKQNTNRARGRDASKETTIKSGSVFFINKGLNKGEHGSTRSKSYPKRGQLSLEKGKSVGWADMSPSSKM